MPELNKVRMEHPRISNLVKKHNVELMGNKTRRLHEMIGRRPMGRVVTKGVAGEKTAVPVPNNPNEEPAILKTSHNTRKLIESEVLKQIREKNADAFEGNADKLFGMGLENLEIKFTRGEKNKITGIAVHKKG